MQQKQTESDKYTEEFIKCISVNYTIPISWLVSQIKFTKLPFSCLSAGLALDLWTTTGLEFHSRFGLDGYAPTSFGSINTKGCLDFANLNSYVSELIARTVICSSSVLIIPKLKLKFSPFQSCHSKNLANLRLPCHSGTDHHLWTRWFCCRHSFVSISIPIGLDRNRNFRHMSKTISVRYFIFLNKSVRYLLQYHLRLVPHLRNSVYLSVHPYWSPEFLQYNHNKCHLQQVQAWKWMDSVRWE